MDINEVKARVQDILETEDYEYVEKEYSLFKDFIKYVASLDLEISSMAKECLKTKYIDYLPVYDYKIKNSKVKVIVGEDQLLKCFPCSIEEMIDWAEENETYLQFFYRDITANFYDLNCKYILKPVYIDITFSDIDGFVKFVIDNLQENTW